MIENENQEEDTNTNEKDDAFDFLNFTGEKLVDYLNLFILRTFFMKKQQQINWRKKDVEKLEDMILNHPYDLKNNSLRISLLSYLILINTISKTPISNLNLLVERVN